MYTTLYAFVCDDSYSDSIYCLSNVQPYILMKVNANVVLCLYNMRVGKERVGN